jgi:acyl carrier protein
MTPSRLAGNLADMATYEETLRGTCELLVRHLEAPRDIQPADRIQEDLGLDSLSVMEFASDVEARFAVNIPSDLYEKLSTVEDVAKAVVKLAR